MGRGAGEVAGRLTGLALTGGFAMKSILIPTEDHDSMPAVLEAARLLARTFDSYMEGFAVRPAIGTYVTVEPVSSLAISGAFEEDTARESAELFEAFMRKHNVPRAVAGEPAVYSYGWPRTEAADESRKWRQVPTLTSSRE